MALLKTAAEIARIRAAGLILSSVIKSLSAEAKPGVILSDLDVRARELILRAGGQPSFLGYKPDGARKPYPAALCASLNAVVVHGLPGNVKLKSGDILKLDLGVKYRGYHSDGAVSVGIGEISAAAQKLLAVTREALSLAIKQAAAGHTLGDIGFAVASYVRKNGFEVIQGLTGHGIGKELHEEPSVPNEGKPGTGLRLEPGMALAIEVMTSASSPKIRQLPDDSYATADGSLSAHFEHTVIITEREALVVT